MRRHVVILGDIACVLTVALLMVGCSQTQRDFEQATRQDTEQGYRDFIRAHEQHDLAREARTRLESLMYRAAMNAADETVVHRFIAEFPNSERAPASESACRSASLIAGKALPYFWPSCFGSGLSPCDTTSTEVSRSLTAFTFSSSRMRSEKASTARRSDGVPTENAASCNG